MPSSTHIQKPENSRSRLASSDRGTPCNGDTVERNQALASFRAASTLFAALRPTSAW